MREVAAWLRAASLIVPVNSHPESVVVFAEVSATETNSFTFAKKVMKIESGHTLRPPLKSDVIPPLCLLKELPGVLEVSSGILEISEEF